MVELNGLRAEVDELEEEYERAGNDLILERLTTARIRLMRRTATLHREVADILIDVGVLVMLCFIRTLLFH